MMLREIAPAEPYREWLLHDCSCLLYAAFNMIGARQLLHAATVCVQLRESLALRMGH